MSIRHRADKNTQFLKTPFVMFNCLCEKRNLNATNIDKHMPNLAETFHSLHEQKDILILPNAWDAASAKVIEEAGAKAIAASSAGVAWALGYP